MLPLHDEECWNWGAEVSEEVRVDPMVEAIEAMACTSAPPAHSAVCGYLPEALSSPKIFSQRSATPKTIAYGRYLEATSRPYSKRTVAASAVDR